MQAHDVRLKDPDRPALLRAQLPERLARLCRRGERLRECWDVNVLGLLVEDAERLAGLCRELGAERLAARLDALHASAAPLLVPARLPDRAADAQIAAALAGVAEERHGAAPLAHVPHDATIHGPVRERGFALFVVPPADYVQRRREAWRAQVARAAAAPARLEGASSAADVAAAPAEPYRILIVEDDRSQLLFADSILRHAGMQTCAAADAVEALDALERFAPELILMDLHMPDCDGLDLTALIRQRPAFVATPIVFLSGDHDARRQAEALRGGGDAFMTKPVRPQQLIDAIGEHVERARRRRRADETKAAPKALRSTEQLMRALSDCLGMDDAATRTGGLLVFSPANASALRARLGAARFGRLLADRAARLAALAAPDELVAADAAAGRLLLFNPSRDANLLEAHAVALRERLVREPVDEADGAREPVGFDVGVCPFVAGARRADAMRQAAQDAIERGRATGRSGAFLVRDAGAPLDPELLDRIRGALAGEGFSLLFQPIVALRGEAREQFQALLRLQGADGRLHAAAEIVPAAVQAGLIGAVDRWALAHCVGRIAAHVAQDAGAPRLFVSQSLESLHDHSAPAWLGELLQAQGVDGDALSLELRAGDVAAAPEAAARYAAAVQALGASLTLSGFEAGAAGERLLRDVPAQFVKISPRYLRAVTDASREELQALVARVHDAGKRVIAPHVEDARGVATLWAAGIDFVQGNFVQHAGSELAFDFHASVT